MKRAKLNAEVDRLDNTIEAIKARHGARSKEYIAALARLQSLKHERLIRDTNFRKSRKHKRAA